MNSKDRLQLLGAQIVLISASNIRSLVSRYLIEKAPDYFFVAPGSSTGKNHAEFAKGEGGLIRHTKAGVLMAMELFRQEEDNSFTRLQKDHALAAIILHDTFKCGYNPSMEESTVSKMDWNHPLYAAKELKELAERKPEHENDLRDAEEIGSLIQTHMGRWVGPVDKSSGNVTQILQKPTTPLQKLVHSSDYFASRRFIEILPEKLDPTPEQITEFLQ